MVTEIPLISNMTRQLTNGPAILRNNNISGFRMTDQLSDNTSQMSTEHKIPQNISFCHPQKPFPYVYIQNSDPSYRTPFVFLRVHKCGSTLLKHFFNRYEFKYQHQVSIVEPSEGPWIGGFPGNFQSKFSTVLEEIRVKNQTRTSQSISSHFRWNLPELNKVYKNQQFFKIAIVRNPLSQWVSGYNYFYGNYQKIERGATVDNYFNLTRVNLACTGSPFKEYVEKYDLLPNSKQSNFVLSNMTKFIEHVRDFTDLTNLPWGFRAVNHQAYDFGLEVNRNYSESEIRQHLSQFDLILVLEKITESLILLKNLMCLSYDDMNLNTLDYMIQRNKKMNFDLVNSEAFTYQRPNQNSYSLDSILQEKLENKFLFNDVTLYQVALDLHERLYSILARIKLILKLSNYVKWQLKINGF